MDMHYVGGCWINAHQIVMVREVATSEGRQVRIQTTAGPEGTIYVPSGGFGLYDLLRAIGLDEQAARDMAG